MDDSCRAPKWLKARETNGICALGRFPERRMSMDLNDT